MGWSRARPARPPDLPGRDCEVKFPFSRPSLRLAASGDGRSVPRAGSPEPRGWARRGDRPRPARAAGGPSSPQLSTQRGGRAWCLCLALPAHAPGAAKVWEGRCSLWLALHTVPHPTLCRVLSSSAPLCFLSSHPALHSAPALRVALSPGTLQGVHSWGDFSPPAPASRGRGYPTTQLSLEETLGHPLPF